MRAWTMMLLHRFRTAGHHQAQTPIKRMQAMFPRLVAGRYNPLRPEV